MDPKLPLLNITGPEGQRMTIPLTCTRTTIGRFPPPVNDIALQPDPQRYVTREMHCYLEHEGAGWYIVSNGRNPTWLCRGSTFRVVQSRTPLADGDRIQIQGGLSESGEPLFWVLLFNDPEGTQPTSSAPYLEYEENTCRLFKVEQGVRERVHLRPLEDKLIRHMWARNRANGDAPVLIPVSELMRAVWDEDEGKAPHTRTEFHRLISSLREKFEPDPETPLFLLNERGLGYLLDTHRLAVPERHGRQ